MATSHSTQTATTRQRHASRGNFLPDEEFVAAWNSSESCSAFCKRTAYSLTSAVRRASSLRRDGWPVKRYRNTYESHGHTGTALHRIWIKMKARCTSCEPRFSKYYRDLGITVCDQWLSSFMAFHDWAMSHGYSVGLTIDRIDGNNGYSPENCRWATRLEQQRNTHKRTIGTSHFKGVCRDTRTGKWKAQIGVSYTTAESVVCDSEVEAAKAYDAMARRRFGDFACCNFPDEVQHG